MIEACHLSSNPHHSHDYFTSQSQLFHHHNFLTSGGSLNKINLPKFMAAATLSSPLPSPPPHSLHHDISPLFIVFLVLALIGIPILIYGLFMIIKCPPNLFRRRPSPSVPAVRSPPIIIGDNMVELVSDLKYNKEEDAKEYGSECPVCLSAFVDGEDVRQLKACKHVFHGACIDMWLQSHSNCPVCRGPVPVKRTKKSVTVGRYRDDDFRQGLPDSASLV